ncbi:MAG: CapA family protein [Parcubacteria group bacterium]
MKKTFYIVSALLIIVAVALGYYIFLNYRAVEQLPVVPVANTKGLVLLEDWQKQQNVDTAEPAKPQEAGKTISLFAVGDIMLSRNVGQKMVEYKDYHYPFLKLKNLISAADISFGNLESPIVAGAPVKEGSFLFRADPASAESLAFAGFDMLSLANNHILNQGKAGLDKTINYLSEQNVGYCGAEKKAGDRLKIFTADDFKVGFFCYSYGPTGLPAGQAGSADVFEMNQKQLLADLKSATTAGGRGPAQSGKGKADFIVVSMHDGVEYSHDNSVHQAEFARAAIDSGADLVIGHHPHVIQNMEQYKGKYIFYSLGNFVFDQMWSLDTRQGVAVKFVITKSGVQSIEYYPIMIDDYSQPRLANDSERGAILKYLKLK